MRVMGGMRLMGSGDFTIDVAWAFICLGGVWVFAYLKFMHGYLSFRRRGFTVARSLARRLGETGRGSAVSLFALMSALMVFAPHTAEFYHRFVRGMLDSFAGGSLASGAAHGLADELFHFLVICGGKG
jgi:hypothetical protein